MNIAGKGLKEYLSVIKIPTVIMAVIAVILGVINIVGTVAGAAIAFLGGIIGLITGQATFFLIGPQSALFA